MGGDTTVQAPAPINPAQVGAESLATQLRLAPDVYNAEALYRPQYAALDNQVLNDSLLGRAGADGSRTGGMLDLYDTASARMGQQQIDANRQQREADIADVSRLGPQARAAYLSANPELARTNDALDARIAAARDVTPRTFDESSVAALSPIRTELQRQAMEELGNNGQLNAADQRAAQQTARAAGAASGMYDSNTTVGAEILGADSLLRARRNDSRTFADTVDQGAFNQTAQNRVFGLQKFQTQEDLNRALMNDSFGRDFSLASMYQSQATDPFQMVLGRSGATSAGMAATGAGTASNQSSGARLFDPFNSSLMQIYGGNQANQLAAQTATANNNAGMSGATMGAIGTIGAGALIAL